MDQNKMMTAGIRENHGGVTSYDEQFQVELKNILDCDGRANVSVIDLKVS
jgi:hypothetical protein